MPDPQPVCSALRHLRPDIRAMGGYTPGEQVRDCIKLNTNECAWGPSPATRQALLASTDDSLRLYAKRPPRGTASARIWCWPATAPMIA